MRDLPSMNPLPPEVAATGQLLADLHDYVASPQLRAVDELLEQIEGEYLQRMRTVSRDDLERLQGALAQVEALRQAMQGRNNGRI